MILLGLGEEVEAGGGEGEAAAYGELGGGVRLLGDGVHAADQAVAALEGDLKAEFARLWDVNYFHRSFLMPGLKTPAARRSRKARKIRAAGRDCLDWVHNVGESGRSQA